MRVRAFVLGLLLAGSGFAAPGDDDLEIGEPPPVPPETIETRVRKELDRLRGYRGAVAREARVAVQALALYTRAVHGDVLKEDRAQLTEWYKTLKRGDDGMRLRPYDVAAIVLAVVAVNADPKAKPGLQSNSAGRPPRGRRFDKEHWRLMDAGIQRLTGKVRGPASQYRGGWGDLGKANLMTTHLVLVALREAGRAGYPVEPEVFGSALDFLKENGAGGSYRGDEGARTPVYQAMGMVCAWICRERLALAKQPVPDWSRELVARTALLDGVFANEAEPPGIECLWAMEQLGSLTGEERLGGGDWYRLGAQRLVASRWGGTGKEPALEAYATCLALLFLRRATAPLEAGR